MAAYNHLAAAFVDTPANATFQIRYYNGQTEHPTRKNIATLINELQNENRLMEIMKVSFGSDLRVYPMDTEHVSDHYDDDNQLIWRIMSPEYAEKCLLEDFWILAHTSTGAVVGPISHRDLITILLS